MFFLCVLEKNRIFAFQNLRKMTKKIPNNLVKLANGALLILFTAIFAFAFILLFKPFESPTFLAISRDRFAAYAAIICSIGLVVLAISRFLMWLYCKRNNLLTYTSYMFWILCEITAISMFCNLFAYLVGTRTQGYFEILGDTFIYSALILLFPYIITTLYFELKDREKAIERIKSRSGIVAEKDEHRQLLFTDEKGNLKLSIKIDSLFYIEAADNYVNICYENKEKITKFCIRNTLKNIETMDLDSDLVRCHRSYIINFKKVKVLKKEKDSLFVELDSKDVPDLPVSKTYADKVLEKFTN